MRNLEELFDPDDLSDATPCPVVWSLSGDVLQEQFNVKVNDSNAKINNTSLNQVYKSYHDMRRGIQRAIAKHHSLLTQIVGGVDFKSACHDDIEEFADGVVNALIMQAQNLYSIEGVPFDVSVSNERTEMGISNEIECFRKNSRKLKGSNASDDLIPIDLDKVKKRLEMKFGGKGGENLFHTQQCQEIVTFLNLKDAQMTEISKGVAISRVARFSKNQFGDTKKYQLDWGRKRQFSKFFDALKVFAKHMDVEGFAEEVNRMCREINDSGDFKMPMTWQQNRVRFKLFTDKIEITLQRDVAKKLQLYIGEFQQH